MASLLIGAGVLSYDAIKKKQQKRKTKKLHNDARFNELEKENAARLTAIQQNTCFCRTSDWTGSECSIHGYVPAASQGSQSSGGGSTGARGDQQQQQQQPPAYVDVTEGGEAADDRLGKLKTQGWTERPPEMDERDVERINVERRKSGSQWGRRKLFFGDRNAPV